MSHGARQLGGGGAALRRTVCARLLLVLGVTTLCQHSRSVFDVLQQASHVSYLTSAHSPTAGEQELPEEISFPCGARVIPKIDARRGRRLYVSGESAARVSLVGQLRGLHFNDFAIALSRLVVKSGSQILTPAAA